LYDGKLVFLSPGGAAGYYEGPGTVTRSCSFLCFFVEKVHVSPLGLFSPAIAGKLSELLKWTCNHFLTPTPLPCCRRRVRHWVTPVHGSMCMIPDTTAVIVPPKYLMLTHIPTTLVLQTQSRTTLHHSSPVAWIPTTRTSRRLQSLHHD